jgi:hypothetical protein
MKNIITSIDLPFQSTDIRRRKKEETALSKLRLML